MYNIRQCTAQLSRTLRAGQVFQKRYYRSTFKSSKSNDSSETSTVAHEQTQVPVPEEVGSREAENAPNDEDEGEMVKMWNKDAVAGPEWNGPRGYEPTKFGDWSSKGRVTDF